MATFDDFDYATGGNENDPEPEFYPIIYHKMMINDIIKPKCELCFMTSNKLEKYPDGQNMYNIIKSRRASVTSLEIIHEV